MAELRRIGYTSGRIVLSSDGVQTESVERVLVVGNGPRNTTRFVLAHRPDFDLGPVPESGLMFVKIQNVCSLRASHSGAKELM